jgi:predicted aspartyl protease
MGKIMQKAIIENAYDIGAVKEGYISEDKIRRMEVEFLVDTGAAMVCLPISSILAMGLKPLHIRNVITATGRVERTIYSPVMLKIFDREANLDVMEVPDGVPPLLGYLALESLDLYPNPTKQILEGNPLYDGKMVIDLL